MSAPWPEGQDKLRPITFKVDQRLLLAIDAAAAREGMARSELIRKAIQEYLEKHHDRA